MTGVRNQGPRAQSRYTRVSWSTPKDIGPGAQSPRTAVRPRALGPELESPGIVGRHRRTSGTGRSRPGQLVNPKGCRTQVRVSQKPHRIRGPSEPGRGHLRHLVDPAGPRTRSRVAQESNSTPWALRPGPESPGTADRHFGDLGTGPSLPGTLVDSGGPQTQA